MKTSNDPPTIQEPEQKKKRRYTKPTILQDDAPDIDEQEREDAFASNPTWDGRELEPFSFARESVFYSLRRSMGSPTLAEINKDFTAFLADAARILWLCSVSKEEITALRSSPSVMQDVIDDWADAAIPPGTRESAAELALLIHNRSTVNHPSPVDDGSPSGN